jgi:hypothetical protein
MAAVMGVSTAVQLLVEMPLNLVPLLSAFSNAGLR